MNKHYAHLFSTTVAIALLFLFGCGGGDGKGGITWTSGVFESENEFVNLCQSPRSGVDINGRSFPDRQGSTLEEMHWLRSWSNNTYLWYDEILDQDPATFSNPIAYFDTLVTNQLTSNGSRKDNFHFSTDTASYLEQTQSGISSGYGVEWVLVNASPPRELRVAFNLANSPAATANLTRGAEILQIDGVDVINGGTQADVDIINAALYPSAPGETHTFVVRDIGETQTREITMTSADVADQAILANQVIATNNGNVGYIMYNTFAAFSEIELINAFTQLSNQNVQDLVLDLRYNGGGRLSLASELSYMIAGPDQINDQIFSQVRFNDKHPTIDPVTGEALIPTPFYDESGGGVATPGIALPTLNLSRVFVLTTGSTCSASEAVINGLRGIDVEVFIIGDTTCGKPYGFYPTDNCGTTYFTIQLTFVNAKGFGEYPDGFTPENSLGTLGEVIPGCSVLDDYNHALGDPEEALLKQALEFRETGTCNAPTTTSKSKSFNAEKTGQGLELKLKKDRFGTIMIH